MQTSLKKCLLGFAVYVFIAAAIGLAIYLQRPPSVVDASAPASEFSAARAMETLRTIAATPHPIGSAAQEDVRRVILSKLQESGVEAEVQSTAVAVPTRYGAVGATVKNIIGRLEGTDPEAKAILLTAHYDSVPNSPGASDDGSGVVVLLETLRALKSGPPLKNDVIFLFNEGEEIGLLGSKAFVDDNSLAKNVAVVLNLEARGANGPVFMFETSDNNGWLINQMAKAVPHPFASSLMYSIYTILPNDTDLTVFKKAGMSGYNLAFIGGLSHYHSLRDDLDSIDVRSIQHGGSYALPLVRHLGNINLDNTKAPNSIYFDILGMTLVTYAGMWTLPISIMLIVLFAGVAIIGLKKTELTIKGMALGFAATLVGIILSVVAVNFILLVLFNVRPGFSPLRNANIFLVSFIAFGIAISSSLVLGLNRWISFNNLTIGSIFLWLIVAVISSFLLPGASYVFQWPVFFLLIAIGTTFLFKNRDPFSAKSLVVICAGVIPGLMLMTASTYNIFTGIMLGMLPILMALVMLSLIAVVPLLKYISLPYKWNLPLWSIFAALGFLMWGMAMPVYDKTTPRKDSVQYSLNVTKNEAVWASSSTRDEWTSQFLTESAEPKLLPDHFPGLQVKFFVEKAPILELGSDDLSVLSDARENGVRTLTVKLRSTRNPRLFGVRVDPNVEVLSAVIDGKRLDYRDHKTGNDNAAAAWELTYNALPREGITLTIELKGTEPVNLTVTSSTDGLPEIPGKSLKPRPDFLIPASYSDNTRVSRVFSLDDSAVAKSSSPLQ